MRTAMNVRVMRIAGILASISGAGLCQGYTHFAHCLSFAFTYWILLSVKGRNAHCDCKLCFHGTLPDCSDCDGHYDEQHSSQSILLTTSKRKKCWPQLVEVAVATQA
ncbi:hypothetical protein PoB_003691100 [Plakobranchus ocellatus]|uniref:Secreted protein n=1 Tax=Plakobranchus ocellatus TaxID=259542 RepID=A0AAV4AGV3_9GAST|nr:hypothetical protein PoB_003691100 [Plakobranchus ocellatus]